MWSDRAWADFTALMDEDLKTAKRIVLMIEEIDRTGNIGGLGKPEPLKGGLSGYWSRRVNKKDRLVYSIGNGIIEITQCRSHYGDR